MTASMCRSSPTPGRCPTSASHSARVSLPPQPLPDTSSDRSVWHSAAFERGAPAPDDDDDVGEEEEATEGEAAGRWSPRPLPIAARTASIVLRRVHPAIDGNRMLAAAAAAAAAVVVVVVVGSIERGATARGDGKTGGDSDFINHGSVLNVTGIGG